MSSEARMIAEALMRNHGIPVYQAVAKFGLDPYQAQDILDMIPTAFGPNGKGLDWFTKFIEKTMKGKKAMDRTLVASELVKIAKLLSAADVAKGHQKAIAIKTLKMNDAMARAMGGMSKDEARSVLKGMGYSYQEIGRIENPSLYSK